MNYSERNSDSEMSMEDILSSIRKYVSEDKETDVAETEKEQISDDKADDNVISLNEKQIANEEPVKPQVAKRDENPMTYQERSTLSTEIVTPEREKKRQSPFEQLTNALNAYGRNKRESSVGSKTVDQLFSEIAIRIIQQWVDSNMEKLVEKIVMREIEKIKSE